MEALQNRIDSFLKQSRVKNPSKTSSYVNVKWPHPSKFLATPETLAEAGFYYNPSFEDRDNVTCFVCGKQLSEWEEGDDPFDIHWEKCGAKCCWASVRCGLRDDMDLHGRFVFTDKTRLPTSKHMERIRLETFSVGDGWIHDSDKNHGATSQKMAHAGFVYTAQQTGDDLATCLYCDVSLSGWDAEDNPMEEHRKREMKSGSSCPFFSVTTVTTSSETSKPPSRTQSHSNPPSKTQPQKHTRSTSVSKSHKELFLPTKTHDGEASTSHDESDNPPASTTSKKPVSGSRRSRVSSTAKTPRKHTRSHSQSKGDPELGDVVEDEEEEAVPTRKSRRPTTIAASTMATPGKSKSQSRSKSVSRAKSKPVEKDEEEQEMVIPLKTPSRSRSKTKVMRDEEEEEEEEVELKKSTRGRPPKAKAKPKSKAASQPEPKLELNDKDGSKQEVEQPSTESKSKPVAATARKPSRAKSKPPPVNSPHESEGEQLSAPLPALVKKAGTASSSTASAKPLKGIKSISNIISSSAQVTHKTSFKVQNAEGDVGDIDAVVQEPEEGTGMANMDALVPAKSAPQEEEHELAPVYVPKKGGKPKDRKGSEEAPKPREGGEARKQAKKPGATKAQAEQEQPGQSLSQASVPEKAKEKTKAGEKDKDKDKGRKSSIMKVVEISTDEEGGNGHDDGDGDDARMDLDLDSNIEKENVKRRGGKENIPGVQESIKDKLNVVDAPAAPAVSNSTSSKPSVQKKQQVFVEIVEPTKAKASLIPPLPSTPFAGPEPGPAEDDFEMAEVENELGSDIGQPPEEQANITILEGFLQTPPRRGPVSSQPQPQPDSQALPAPTHPTLVLPALSKLPFTPVENLTDAELDMTVEEWIRYHMGVEFDKFRRDGERELQRWVGRAREVRAVIEAL